METMQFSLTDQMTESGAVARLQISIRKLVQKQLDSGDINTQLLRAAFDLQVGLTQVTIFRSTLHLFHTCAYPLCKTQSTVAKQLDDALDRAKSRKLKLNILQFATAYFPLGVKRKKDKAIGSVSAERLLSNK